MRETRYDGRDVRRVIAGMVTDQTVCSRIAARWPEGGLFDSAGANLVGGWCVAHMRRYGRPPGRDIQSVYESWAAGRNGDDRSTTGVVERLMAEASRAYEREAPELSSEYLLDLAGEVFDGVRIHRTFEEIEADIESNDWKAARRHLTECRTVDLGIGSMLEPMGHLEPWRDSWDREDQMVLIRCPGGLGRFFEDRLSRESLVAFMGPDKTGKSWLLLDMAYRALRDRRRVAYFDAGDMGERETLVRLGKRAARRPRHPCRVKWPTGIDPDKGGVYEDRTFEEELGPADAFRALRRASRIDRPLRLSCHSNSTVSVDGLHSILREWETDGWVPDVVVIDYADILAPPHGVKDTLDQVDETWKRLRRMSQDFHCLVLTATQSNAAAYGGQQRTLGRRHFSGRKTKLAHVNGMIGLNQTEEEKRRGVIRLNWVVQRRGRFLEGRCCTVIGCLDVGCPILVSDY